MTEVWQNWGGGYNHIVRYFYYLISNMERKKEFLIKVLNKIKTYRPLAEGFLSLLESEYATEEIMDKLILALKESLDEIKEENEKTKIEKSLELIQKIKEEEMEEKIADGDLDDLLDNI